MRILFEQGTPAPSRDHLTGRSPERSSTRRAGLRPPRQEQLEELVDLGAVPQILEQRGDRRPSAAEHPGAVHLLRGRVLRWRRSSRYFMPSLLSCSPADPIRGRDDPLRRRSRETGGTCAPGRAPASHGLLPCMPRCAPPSPSSPTYSARLVLPIRIATAMMPGKSGASDGRLHQGPIAREEAQAGPRNTRWPRRGSRSGTRRR